MALPELGLSDAGLVVPRMADYLDIIRGSYTEQSGIAVDWDNDLFLGITTSIMAQLLDQQSEGLQAIYDAGDLNAARGVQLSNLSLLVGVARRRPTFGQAVVALGGTPGTVITEGKIVEGGGDDDRAWWETTEDVTLDGDGFGEVVVRAQVSGRTIALSGTIIRIVTPVPGWSTVTNPDNASAGVNAETDDQLRIRRAQSIQTGSAQNIASIRAKALALSYIESAAVIDNPDNEDQVVEGIAMQAHSYLLVVLPDTLTADQQEEVLQLLYDNTPVGSRTSGTDVTGTVTGLDGFEKVVSFDYAQEVPADIIVDLTMDTGYSVADAGPALQELVEEHISLLLIGQPLLNLRIAALAATIPGVIGITTTINGSPNLQVSAAERVTFGSWSAS
jgi:Baseplate J-like protein